MDYGRKVENDSAVRALCPGRQAARGTRSPRGGLRPPGHGPWRKKHESACVNPALQGFYQFHFIGSQAIEAIHQRIDLAVKHRKVLAHGMRSLRSSTRTDPDYLQTICCQAFLGGRRIPQGWSRGGRMRSRCAKRRPPALLKIEN